MRVPELKWQNWNSKNSQRKPKTESLVISADFETTQSNQAELNATASSSCFVSIRKKWSLSEEKHNSNLVMDDMSLKCLPVSVSVFLQPPRANNDNSRLQRLIFTSCNPHSPSLQRHDCCMQPVLSSSMALVLTLTLTQTLMGGWTNGQFPAVHD